MLDRPGDCAEHNRARCRERARALEQISAGLLAMFTRSTPASRGPSTPAPIWAACIITWVSRCPMKTCPRKHIADQRCAWKATNGVLFDDSWPQEAISHTSEP